MSNLDSTKLFSEDRGELLSPGGCGVTLGHAVVEADNNSAREVLYSKHP
jgi:hypothetical protein